MEINDEDFYIECWELVKLTPFELNAICDALDADDQDAAEQIVNTAYDRIFGVSIN